MKNLIPCGQFGNVCPQNGNWLKGEDDEYCRKFPALSGREMASANSFDAISGNRI
jgi:hypothetical protein